MSTLHSSSFEAMTNNINKVIQGFNNGKAIVVFKGNHTIVMSNKLHTEASLMKHINGATIVRICA